MANHLSGRDTGILHSSTQPGIAGSGLNTTMSGEPITTTATTTNPASTTGKSLMASGLNVHCYGAHTTSSFGSHPQSGHAGLGSHSANTSYGSNTPLNHSSTSTAVADPHLEDPSSMHGMKEKMMGAMEKGIGKVTGNSDKVAEGEARKLAGDAEREAAKNVKNTHNY
ncbi:hypothetical protein SeLEV6574_g03841 [Synchytrium endobioticum]|uniref:CsbD-like domain-containing protein n=1 Tax=Synchytrium endobioticum TaxID=286115 RepID=A0A507D210_9FUNG|nr:hypothetical protein SeLEV6574_g03843 [Synchytrium endobioticum]TPX45503.1 hypothetical protein SeLEV6574_g03841 [Synchytrium endobioticum]